MLLVSKKFVTRKTPALAIGHYCIGCDDLHFVPLKLKGDQNFNYKFNLATFKKTFRFTWGTEPSQQCQYVIIAGTIRYFSYCMHDYAGASMVLPDIPQHMIESFNIKPKKASSK